MITRRRAPLLGVNRTAKIMPMRPPEQFARDRYTGCFGAERQIIAEKRQMHRSRESRRANRVPNFDEPLAML